MIPRSELLNWRSGKGRVGTCVQVVNHDAFARRRSVQCFGCGARVIDRFPSAGQVDFVVRREVDREDRMKQTRLRIPAIMLGLVIYFIGAGMSFLP